MSEWYNLYVLQAEGKPLVLGQILVGFAVVAIGTIALYGGLRPADAASRPPTKVDVNDPTEDLKRGRAYYEALLAQDAKSLGVELPSFESLRQPLAYFDEIRGQRPFKINRPVETRHLEMILEVQGRQATVDGQKLRADHLVLKIKNRSSKYLAYRVATSLPPGQRCGTKGEIPHNAVVLLPGATIERTECLHQKEITLRLDSAEVIELPELSAAYVSRLPPSLVLYDPRTAAGHVPMAQPMCRPAINPQEIRRGVEMNQFGWKDIIDFYARHSCLQYTFFDKYRLRADASGELPALPATVP